MQNIQISITPDYRARVRAQMFFNSKRGRGGRRFIGILFFGYGLLQLLLSVFDLITFNPYATSSNTFDTIGFLFPLLLLLVAAELWFHLILRGRIWLAMHKPQLLRTFYLPTDFIFTQDAASFRTSMVESVNQWETFHNYYENKHLFLLTLMVGGFWSLPKNQIKSQEDMTALRSLLNEKIGEQDSSIVYVEHYGKSNNEDGN